MCITKEKMAVVLMIIFNKEECSDEFIEALQEHICRIFDSCFEKDYRKLMLDLDRSRGYAARIQ